jgi:hypothetical protein
VKTAIIRFLCPYHPSQKIFFVLMLRQYIFKEGVLHTGIFSAHTVHWFAVEEIAERTYRARFRSESLDIESL